MEKRNMEKLALCMVLAALSVSAAKGGSWQEFIVYPATDDQQAPDIHGNIVAWQQQSVDSDWDIYYADITNPESPSVYDVADYEDQTNPAVYGERIVWQDYYYGNWDIFGIDIENPGAIFAVADFNEQQVNPVIYGSIVVWQDDFYGDWDIFATDISDLNNLEDTGKEFQITDNPANQTNPAISGNVVVWQDDRNENWNIYAVILDGAEAAKCLTMPDGDIDGDCKVDFTDFALMAAGWLDCNLEPQQICRQ